MIVMPLQTRNTIFAFLLLAFMLSLTMLLSRWSVQVDPAKWIFAVGVLYAALFLMAAWRFPYIALMLTFASAPFQSDVSGGGGFAKFSVAEINLLLSASVFVIQNLVRRKPMSIGPLAVPVLLYFLVCLYSSYQTWRPDSALISLLQMFLYFVVAVVVFSNFAYKPEELLTVLNGIVCVGAFLAIAGMGTSYGFMGMNKNGIGASLACACVTGVEMWFAATNPRRRRLLASAVGVIVVGLIFSLSRGAWMSTLAGLFAITALRRQYAILLRAGLLLVPLVAACWFALPQESKEYATGLGSERVNIQLRYASVDLAKKNFDLSPIYGVGVGLRKEYDATNILMLTLAETGVAGLVTFLLIHGSVLRALWTTQKYMTRNDPLYSLTAVAGALVLGKFLHGCVDHYWSRGAVMMVWASVGMALCARRVALERMIMREGKLQA